MQYVFGQLGIKLPRTAAQQQKFVQKVDKPAPGDLVFWGNPATHVALYIGDGKMIAAPHSGEKVRIQSVYGSPTYGRVAGIGSLTAPVTDVVQTVGLNAGDFAASLIDKLRPVTLEVIAVGFGIVLVIVGGQKIFLRPLQRRTADALKGAL